MIIKEIILSTSKLNELKYFYAVTLGLELKNDDENSLTVKAGDSLLTFNRSSVINKPVYHFAFNIPENKFRQSKDWISKRVELIKLDGEDEFDFTSWNAHSIYFYDAAGNILEFIARHNLSNKTSEAFSAESILNISEIGLPVNDVNNFYSEVKMKFNIPVFSGDQKTFCTAGDDNGLFIIVKKGRKWFPDCGTAEIFPATVKIKSDKQKEPEFENLSYKIISGL